MPGCYIHPHCARHGNIHQLCEEIQQSVSLASCCTSVPQGQELDVAMESVDLALWQPYLRPPCTAHRLLRASPSCAPDHST